MTPRHYSLTLTGAAQQLSDALPVTEANPATPGVPASGADRASRKFNSWDLVTLQGDAACAAIFLGGDNTVTNALYGIRLPASSGGVAPPPLFLGPFTVGKIKFENFWVIGTASDVLHILAIEW